MTHPTNSKELEELMQLLGCIYSEENGAWMYSRLGMGFTTQIEDEMATKIFNHIKAEKLALLDELESKKHTHSEKIDSGDEYIDFEYIPLAALKDIRESL